MGVIGLFKAATNKARWASLGERLLRKRWIRLAANVFHQLGKDGVGDMAAGVAYYALLSVFPLALGAIALLGLVLPSQVVQDELFAFFGRHLPTSVGLLEENISGIIALRGTLGVLSLVGSFWSGSAIFGAIGRAVNRAFDVYKFRPFVIRRLRDMLLAAGTSVLFLVSLGLKSTIVFLETIETPVLRVLTATGGQLASFAIMVLVFLLIYKFMPNRRISWRHVWPGAFLGAVLFEIARSLFVLYVARFATYDLIYGSVASIIVIMVWMYISAFILILGAEFVSEYDRMAHNRQTTPARPPDRQENPNSQSAQ